jgi:hypothetical protein
MPRRRIIRPQPVEDWPYLFWSRCESSYAGNDLECRGGCLGTGLVARRRVCPRCRGSGLLVPRRTPARPRDLTLGEPAWAGVASDQLVWPLPWMWEVSLIAVPVARDLYHADEDVLAFLSRGRLCLALFQLDGDAERRLEEVYRMAAGGRAVVSRFLLPADPGDAFCSHLE